MGCLQSILVIILTLLTFTANGYSVCDALDVFLLIDTEFIIQDAENILSIIDGIIVDGSNEDTGFSAIIFGDIPPNMDNLLFNIDATHKVHRRQKQISFINEKLAQTFATIQNNAGMNTQRISLRDALNTAYNEEKPKRNHKNKAKHGNKVGHHNDDDVMIIFDYNGQHTILDPENLAEILAEFNTADDKEITFILGQWFDEFSNTSLAILNETREIISDSDAQHLFFPIYAFTPNGNPQYLQMRDFLYLKTCPAHVEIDHDNGYDANLKNNVQYIEPETFIACHDSDTSDTLFVYVYQDLSDESTATFAINGILMTDLETEENELPADCDRVLYVIQNIIIFDDHREIFALLTDEQKAGDFQILEIETSIPTNISDYVRSVRASGTSPVGPNVVHKNKNKNKNKKKRSLVYQSFVDIDKSDSITLNNPFDFDVTFTLEDTISKGYEKKTGQCTFKIDGTVKVTIALELSLAMSNFNAAYNFDISFGIACSGDWWNPTTWGCDMTGNFFVEFIVSGDIGLGAEPSLSISGYSVVSLECVYEPDTLVWILVIPVYYTPIIKIKSQIKTRPVGVSVGLDCDYNFRFRLGATLSGSSKSITKFNQLPGSACTPYYEIAGLETCGLSLGFEWSLTVTGGLRLYSLVEVTVAATVGIPFVVKIPDIDQCGCNNGAKGGAGFDITFGVKAGVEFGAVGVLDEMYKAWKGGEDKKYDKLTIGVMVPILPTMRLLTVQLGCFPLPSALSDFLVNACDCANADFVFAPSNVFNYGSIYSIQNVVSEPLGGGGYLDVCGSGCEGNFLCVSTATTAKRHSSKTGYWKIIPVDGGGKNYGDRVTAGDLIHLENQYIYGVSYLDTRVSGCEENFLCVSASSNKDRAGVGTGTWKIKAADQNGDLFHLQNIWNGNGGYLDTRGNGCEGNFLCVSTSTSSNRHIGSGTWKFKLITPWSATVLDYGSIYSIQNVVSEPHGGGGYLDTRGGGCEGNFLCVSTARTATRDGSKTGYWKIMPVDGDGKNYGDIVNAGDLIHLENQYIYGVSYLETRGSGCEQNLLCVSASSNNKPTGKWKIKAADQNGDLFHLHNIWAGYWSNGGYLDTRGNGCEGNYLCVSTSISSNRHIGSGTWKFKLITPWSAAALYYGSIYSIQNVVSKPLGGGGYLDVRGGGCEGNFLCVSTARTATRDSSKTGYWKIIPVDGGGKNYGDMVSAGDLIHLENQWIGGVSYLETKGIGCEGNFFCVSASSNKDMAGFGTAGFGKIWGIKAADHMQNGDLMNIHLQNIRGYLDTRGHGCEGNFLCVSTSISSNRHIGSGTWKFKLITSAQQTNAMKIRDGRYNYYNISQGMMVVGLGLLVLSVSMIMINYLDCSLKERMKRISFNKNVGNGYDSVKLNESDMEEENPML